MLNLVWSTNKLRFRFQLPLPLVLSSEYTISTSCIHSSILCWTKRPSSKLMSHSHCKMDWVQIQAGSRQCTFEPVRFSFVCSHYCKLTSVMSFSAHDPCASFAWPLQVEPCQRKWRFFWRLFNFVSLHQVDRGHSRGPVRSQEPWFGRSSSQPSLPHWTFVCAREHSVIYRHTNNVYILLLQVRIHFKLDQNHLMKWIGSELVWIRFKPIHFLCELEKCALNQMRVLTECAVWIGLKLIERTTNKLLLTLPAASTARAQ